LTHPHLPHRFTDSEIWTCLVGKHNPFVLFRHYLFPDVTCCSFRNFQYNLAWLPTAILWCYRWIPTFTSNFRVFCLSPRGLLSTLRSKNSTLSHSFDKLQIQFHFFKCSCMSMISVTNFLFFKSCYFVASFHFHNDFFSDTIIKLNTLKNLPHSAFRFAHFECKHSNSLTGVLILMRSVIFNLFTGFRRFTHTVSNSAFRSFGQPHFLVWFNISIKVLTWTTFSFSWLLTRM